jgi:cytoskeletal protein RodZ
MRSSTSSLDRLRTLEPRLQLDPQRCATLGEALTEARVERGLTIEDASRVLLLSVRQVRALETVDFSAFYNASFYMKALEKYAAFCGLPSVATNAAFITAKPVTPTAPPLSNRLLRHWGTLAAMLLTCVAIGLGWSLFLSGGSPVLVATESEAPAVKKAKVEPKPSVPVALQQTPAGAPTATPLGKATHTPLPAEAPAAASDTVNTAAGIPRAHDVAALAGEPATALEAIAAVPQAHNKYGALHLPQSTWMFLRQSDNTVIERTVAAGETVEFRAKPRYLALGSSDAELTIGIRAVDITRFIRNGTLRMGAAEFTSIEETKPPSDEATPAQNESR